MTPAVAVEPVEVGPRPRRLRSGRVITPAYARLLVHQGRWSALHPQSRADIVAEWTAAVAAAIEAIRRAVAAFLEAARVAWAHVRGTLVDAGLVPKPLPVDVPTRALELRRARNTGPRVHADPRRNR